MCALYGNLAHTRKELPGPYGVVWVFSEQRYNTSYTPYPTPDILHPVLYTLHPLPFTQHPTPYTLSDAVQLSPCWNSRCPYKHHRALLPSLTAILNPPHKARSPPHCLHQPCLPINLYAPPFEERLHQLRFGVWGWGFRVQGFGFRVSGFGSRV